MVLSVGSPWWASAGRPPRFRFPRGSRVAIRVLAGFFFGVQPSGFGPLGRMVEGSPGGSPFAAPDLPETLPGNEGEAAVNVRLYRRFLDLRKCSLRRESAPERAFPKTGQVVRRRSETTCRTPGRFNRPSPNIPTTSHKVTGDTFRMRVLDVHPTLEALYSSPDRTSRKG